VAQCIVVNCRSRGQHVGTLRFKRVKDDVGIPLHYCNDHKQSVFRNYKRRLTAVKGSKVEKKKKKSTQLREFKCLKCTAMWHARRIFDPKFCPKCCNPYWNES